MSGLRRRWRKRISAAFGVAATWTVLASCFVDETADAGGSTASTGESTTTTLGSSTSSDAVGTSSTGGDTQTDSDSGTTAVEGTTGIAETWEPEPVWEIVVDASAGARDRADALVVGETSFWIAGQVGMTVGPPSLWVGEFDSVSGEELRTALFGSPSIETLTTSKGAAFGPAGRLIIAGTRTLDSSTPQDRLLLQYDPADDDFMEFGPNPPSAGYDVANDVATLGPSTLVVGATTASPADEHRDIWYARYNANLLPAWEQPFDASEGDDEAYAVVADGDHLIIAGAITTPNGDRDGWVRQVRVVDGSEVWTEVFTGGPGAPANENQEARGIALTSAGDTVVVGNTEVPGQGLDVWVQVYSGSGALGWSSSFVGEVSDDDARGVAVNLQDDSVYVCGSTTQAGEGRNIWLGKFVAGELLGWVSYTGVNAQDDGALDCAVVGDNVVVTGFAFADNGNRNLVAVAYPL